MAGAVRAGEAALAVKPRTLLPALLALGALSAIWGYNWVVMKLALADSGPFVFAALRTVLGALALFATLAILRRPLAPRALRGVFVLGLLQTTGFVGLTIWALQAGGAGKTAVLVYTMPFWVLVLAWPLLGERLRGWQWPGVVLAFIGLVLVLAPWTWRDGGVFSELLALMAGLSWALSAIVAKAMRPRDFDLLSLTAWQMLLGGLPLLALAAWVPAPPTHWSPYFIMALIYNAIPGNAIAWLLWLYTLRALPAGLASLGTLVTPVIGVLAAWLQLGERPGYDEAAGMIMIGAALALISLDAVRRHRRTEALVVQE